MSEMNLLLILCKLRAQAVAQIIMYKKNHMVVKNIKSKAVEQKIQEIIHKFKYKINEHLPPKKSHKLSKKISYQLLK